MAGQGGRQLERKRRSRRGRREGAGEREREQRQQIFFCNHRHISWLFKKTLGLNPVIFTQSMTSLSAAPWV